MTAVEGNDQKKHKVYFLASLSAPAGQDVTFKYKTLALAKDKAIAGQDFTAIPEDNAVSVTIAAGQTLAYLPVEIIGNATQDGDRTFSIAIFDVAGAAIQGKAGGELAAAATIKDDEVSLSVGNASIMEGSPGKPSRDMWFPLTLSAPAKQDVVIRYATSADSKSKAAATGGDASGEGMDYLNISDATITIPKGQMTAYVPVAVWGDQLVESNETFALVISEVSGAGIAKGKNSALGTILDDESTATPAPAQLQLSSARVVEPDKGSIVMDFAIMLSAPASTAIQIDYRTKDLPPPVTTTTGSSPSGTTTASGSGVAANSPAVPRAIARKDYLPEKGTLVIKAGETRGDIRVNVLADDLQEADELFNLVLSNARGVALDASNSKSLTLTGTIQDHAYPVLSAQATSCLEGTRSNGTPSDMVFALTLSEAGRYPVSLNFATARKTATDLTGALQKKDFQPVSGKLTFSPGETIKYIHVPIVPDRLGEPSETVRLVLDKLVGADFPASTASAATPVASQPQLVVIGTILDDEPTVIV